MAHRKQALLNRLQQLATATNRRYRRGGTLFDYKTGRTTTVTAVLFSNTNEPWLIAAEGKHSLQLCDSYPSLRYCVDLNDTMTPLYDSKTHRWQGIDTLPAINPAPDKRNDTMWRILLQGATVAAAAVLLLLLYILL